MNTDKGQKSECEEDSKAPDGRATQVRTSAGGEDTTALLQGPNVSERLRSDGNKSHARWVGQNEELENGSTRTGG
jgi:hypothetical protein